MKDFKLHIVIYASLFVMFIVLTFGVSLAWFSATVSGNDTAKNTSISSGKLDISFTTSEYINETNMFLIDDSAVETDASTTSFVVSHTAGSNVNANYNVSLTDFSISDNFINSDFKWQLLKNNVVIYSGNFSNAVSGSNYLLNSSVINLPVGASDSLVLRVWLSSQSYNQNSLTNGSFSAKVMVDAVAV